MLIMGCFGEGCVWSGLKHAHQARFWGVFVPGGAKNLPTRRVYGVFSYLVLLADPAVIL